LDLFNETIIEADTCFIIKTAVKKGVGMLLETYQLEIFNSKCMPGSMGVHCFAHLDQNVAEAIPYLNTVLGGFTFTKEPLSVTFKSQGKLITVHP